MEGKGKTNYCTTRGTPRLRSKALPTAHDLECQIDCSSSNRVLNPLTCPTGESRQVTHRTDWLPLSRTGHFKVASQP